MNLSFLKCITPLFSRLQQKQKFVLSVGDEGAVLTYTVKGHVEDFVAANLAVPEEMQALKGLLALHPNVAVSILVDVVDQSYSQQSLPGVNALSMKSLLQRKLQRDFPATDIKGSVAWGRRDGGRKDWQFLFASAPFVPPLSTWVNLVLETSNPIAGIFFLPLETTSVLETLNKNVFTQESGTQRSPYQIILTHNKVSGFRQTALHKDRIIFTRVVDPGKDNAGDAIATAIEQELLNAVEYLRRLSFQDDDGLDVFIIISPEVKSHFVPAKQKGKNIFVFTPFEAAGLLQLKDAATEKTQYADTLLANSFVTHKPVLILHTPLTKKIAGLFQMHNIAFVATLCIIPLLVIWGVILLSSVWLSSREIDHVAQEKSAVEQRLNQAKKEALSAKEAFEIRDRVVLHTTLSANVVSPLSLLAAFQTLQKEDVVVSVVEWRLKEAAPKLGAAPGAKNTPVTQATFKVEFLNKDNNLEGLLKSFDVFTNRLVHGLPLYDVQYSGLPEKLDVDVKNASFPVQITVTEPKKQVAKPIKR